MAEVDIAQELKAILDKIIPVPEKRQYWLVRTHAGDYFDSFKEFNYIGLGHNKIKLSTIDALRKKWNNDLDKIRQELKAICADVYGDDEEEVRTGLIASQIFRFVFEIKKGDVVLIPSHNSDAIAFGRVKSTPLMEVTNALIEKTDCPYRLRKEIIWDKTVFRSSLDPYLYRAMQTHQAINNISKYGDLVERTLGNFYIKNDEANLILDIETTEHINAKKLFDLGHYLLNFSQGYFDYAKLGISVDDVEVKLNLNSKGKIQFKAPKKETIWLIAVIVLAINGGGLKVKWGNFDFDMSTNGVIKNIIDYQNNKHDRAMVDTIKNSIDTLKVQSPDDAVKVFKQFSSNKDLPK